MSIDEQIDRALELPIEEAVLALREIGRAHPRELAFHTGYYEWSKQHIWELIDVLDVFGDKKKAAATALATQRKPIDGK